jgi:hypothetical protein
MMLPVASLVGGDLDDADLEVEAEEIEGYAMAEPHWLVPVSVVRALVQLSLL